MSRDSALRAESTDPWQNGQPLSSALDRGSGEARRGVPRASALSLTSWGDFPAGEQTSER